MLFLVGVINMKCKICGSRMEDGITKCPVCGASVSTNESKPSVTQVKTPHTESSQRYENIVVQEEKVAAPVMQQTDTTYDNSQNQSSYSSSSYVNKNMKARKFNWYAFFFLFANAGYNRHFSCIFGGPVAFFVLMLFLSSFENSSAYILIMIVAQIVISIFFGFFIEPREKKSVVGLFVGMFVNLICTAIFNFFLYYGISGFEEVMNSILNG